VCRALQRMRAQPDVGPARAVIVGQSFGGTIAIAPYGEDGHALFSHYPEVWQPRVRAFLDQAGLIRQRR
jgi:dienelactone hydrolase